MTSRFLTFRGARPGVVSLLLLACGWVDPTAAATTWDFRTGGASELVSGGAFSLHRIFSAGDLSVEVTAWSDTAVSPAGAFGGAYPGRYATGLGVCNKNEALVSGSLANCVFDGGLHDQVDNVGEQDVVLFLFSERQALESITIDPFGTYDRDISFWIGEIAAPLGLAGLTVADLSGVGFGPRVDSFNPAGGEPLTVALGGVAGNALLIGALYPADTLADKFKIQSITTTAPSTAVVPLPGALWPLGSALALLSSLRRRPLAAG